MSADVHARVMQLLEAGRAAEAADLLEGVRGDPRMESVRAFALQLAGRFDESAVAYDSAIRHARNQLAGLEFNRAVVLTGAGRQDEAAKGYEAAIELAPDSNVARINLGAILHRQGKLEEAERQFRAAVETDPDDVQARTSLGAVLSGLKRFEEAEAELAQAATGEGVEAARAQAGLASVLSARGRHVEAIAAARGAVMRAPDLADAHEQLANVAHEADDFATALTAAERACELEETATTQELRGAALAGLKRLDEAAEAFRRATELAPTTASGWRNLGRVLDRMAALGPAIEAYKRSIALGLDPDDYLLASALARHGEVDEAIEIMRRICARRPDDVSMQHLLTSLTGEQPPEPPPGYVSGLFDDYAPRFERHLVEDLGYQGHLVVSEALGDERGARGLDLGCGTGLVGVAIRERVDELTGVDLSSRMIEASRAKGIYDALEVADVVSFLRGAAEPRYDIVTSADVLIYVGDLEPFFAALAPRLAPGGRVAFTIEAGAAPWKLERHGLAVATQADVVLRQEQGMAVPGVVFLLRAPG